VGMSGRRLISTPIEEVAVGPRTVPDDLWDLPQVLCD
jgi:hypothetical protein